MDQTPDEDAAGKVCILITGVSNQDTHYHILSAVPFPRVILCAFFFSFLLVYGGLRDCVLDWDFGVGVFS